MKKLLILFLVSILTVASFAKEGWEVDEGTIYTHGTIVHGHKFGYFKDDEYCDTDLIFLRWSTYEDGLEEYKGIDAKIEMRLNGSNEVFEVIPSTLMTTYKFPALMTIGEFKTIILSERLSKAIRESDSIEFTFIGPVGLVDKLDIKSDTFNTSSFPKAHLQKYNACKDLHM